MSAGVSAQGDRAIFVGEDGFEFHGRERCFEQLCGDIPFDPADLRRWTVALESRHAWCRARGIAYLPMIVPERHVVLWDRLPEGVSISANRPVRQLRDALAPVVRTDFIYPEHALRAGASEHEVFPRADGPWTPYGAFLAYRALAQAMGRHAALTPLGDDELRWPQGEADENAPIAITRAPLARPIFQQGPVHVFAGGAEGMPKLVLFGEPAALRLVDPFLLAHVSRLVLVSGRAFLPELVRAERPDFAVSLVAEHYLGSPAMFVNELERVNFTGITGVSLPLPTQ